MFILLKYPMNKNTDIGFDEYIILGGLSFNEKI